MFMILREFKEKVDKHVLIKCALSYTFSKKLLDSLEKQYEDTSKHN